VFKFRTVRGSYSSSDAPNFGSLSGRLGVQIPIPRIYPVFSPHFLLHWREGLKSGDAFLPGLLPFSPVFDPAEFGEGDLGMPWQAEFVTVEERDQVKEQAARPRRRANVGDRA